MSIRTRRKPMRAIAAVAAAAVGASLLAISAPTGVGAAPTVTEQTRIAGADRYATANAVALAAVGTRTNVTSVVIASGENFPDGLAASALAGALNAPMLLTQSGALPTSVLATLTTIRATNTGLRNAVLVGGTSVISADIATQLTAIGMTVTRIAGDTRYATANAVAGQVRTNNSGVIGSFGGYRTAFLANGNNFPDALAASSWAYRNKHPLFLTNGTSVDADTVAAMIAAGVQQVIILGGTSAVSAEVATAVAGVSGVLATVRVSGDTRYDTATALATTLATVDADYKTRAMLVSGTNFPDALAAAQLAGMDDSYALIPVTSPLPAAVSTWVTANQSTLTTIRAIGGTEAIPADVVTEVKTGATQAPLTATIAGLDGATTATVTFSSAVATGATTTTNYTVRSAAGAAKTVSGVTLNSAGTVATLTIGTALAPGDVISVVGASIQSAATSGLYVAATSFTVVADATAPTVTIVAYPTSNSATASSPSNAYTNRVWVTLSSNASISAGTVPAMLQASLTYTPTGIGATASTPFSGCALIAGTTTFTCNVTGELVAGASVSLAANKVFSAVTTPVGNAAASATVTADTTAPAISSATYTQTATGGTQASFAILGEVTLSARATAAKDGRVGNAVSVALALDPAAAAAPTCVYSSSTNTITVTAATTTSALLLASNCNATASFNALFVAAATTSNNLTGFNTAAAAAMSGGADLVTMTITASEALGAFNNTNLTLAGITGATTPVVVTTASVEAVQELAGVLTVTTTTTGSILPGLASVAFTASAADRVGNAAGTTAVTLVAAS